MSVGNDLIAVMQHSDLRHMLYRRIGFKTAFALGFVCRQMHLFNATEGTQNILGALLLAIYLRDADWAKAHRVLRHRPESMFARVPYDCPFSTDTMNAVEFVIYHVDNQGLYLLRLHLSHPSLLRKFQQIINKFGEARFDFIPFLNTWGQYVTLAKHPDSGDELLRTYLIEQCGQAQKQGIPNWVARTFSDSKYSSFEKGAPKGKLFTFFEEEGRKLGREYCVHRGLAYMPFLNGREDPDLQNCLGKAVMVSMIDANTPAQMLRDHDSTRLDIQTYRAIIHEALVTQSQLLADYRKLDPEFKDQIHQLRQLIEQKNQSKWIQRRKKEEVISALCTRLTFLCSPFALSQLHANDKLLKKVLGENYDQKQTTKKHFHIK